MQSMPHDPRKCKCDTDSGCNCQCPKCLAYIATRVHLSRLAALSDRLKKSGIDIEDFADLVWIHIEATIEAKISKIATEQVKAALRGVKLISAVKWDSID